MVDTGRLETVFMDEDTADVHFLFKSNAVEILDEDKSDAQKSTNDEKPNDARNDKPEDVNDNANKLSEHKNSGAKKRSSDAVETGSKTEVFQRVAAHKLMLAIASPVFRAMFFGGLKEAATIEIKDVSSEAFKEFLQFCYITAPKVTLEYVGEVLYLADKYDMANCTTYRFKYLETCINAKQVLSVYDHVIRFKNKEIIKKCEPMIVSNATAILTDDTFLRCPRTVLKNMMALNGLTAQQKFKACMEWSRNECLLVNKDPNDMMIRRLAIGDCFKLIDFSAMRSNELLECIDRSGDLFDYEEISELFKSVLRKYPH